MSAPPSIDSVRKKNWRYANPEKAKATAKAWRDRNPEKIRAYCKKWGGPQNRTPEKSREYQHNYYIRRRMAVLSYYGGSPPACACCGETEIKFLSVDHINGGGNKHRKELKNQSIYAWIMSHKFPEGFQILCHNCNLAKGYYGTCPHTQSLI